MKQIEIQGHIIKFFDSVDNLPFKRMNEFNKYILLDAHLGSSIFDFDKLLGKTDQFLGKNMVVEAKMELQNLRQVVHNILTGNNIKGYAFACMIKSIDNEEVTDFSSDNLTEILNRLDGWGLLGIQVNETVSTLKKK